ncbi:MAG: S41 family peptidase [Chloroflexi bacterium]|nr:S41 family peptidase [Chloroflexota bacterium]
MIRYTLRVLAMLIASGVFILSTFTAGAIVQHSTVPAFTSPPLPPTVENTPQPVPAVKDPAEADFTVFWEVWNIIRSEFLGKVPDNQAMTYAAIKGVIDALGDEHTHFSEPTRASILQSDLEGKFEGIGATVDAKSGQIVIVAPLKNSPAEKAGIQAGDIVTHIDGKSTDGLNLTDAVSLIRGPKGTQVTLTIVRVGSPTPIQITITRATIELEVVSQRQLDNGLVYLRLEQFSAPSSQAVDAALQTLLRTNPKGLIFDLRGNPGGFLQSAIEIGSEFISTGLILSEQDKSGNRQPHPALPGGRATKIPLVVLVDKGSASASEIVAGAIRDSKRGKLVGEKTFGKGSVQISNTLSDQSRLTVTIRHWLTPSGQDIHGAGIEPDIAVPITEADRKSGRDPQLDRAIQFLLTGA